MEKKNNANSTPNSPKVSDDIQIEPLADADLDSVAGGCLWVNSCSADSCSGTVGA
jgi:hypothetical protein